MVLLLERLYSSDKNGTMGILSYVASVGSDDKKTMIGFTLEKTSKAIPEGSYDMVVNHSPKFGKNLPLIYNEYVPAQRGIRIHGGNTVKDSNGCILLGTAFDYKNFKLSGCSLPVNELCKLKGNITLIIEEQ